jgi:hypothetical protein
LKPKEKRFKQADFDGLYLLVKLLCPHATALLLPAAVSLFSRANLSDCINPRHALPHKDFNLPQLHDNLFGLRSLIGHL